MRRKFDFQEKELKKIINQIKIKRIENERYIVFPLSILDKLGLSFATKPGYLRSGFYKFLSNKIKKCKKLKKYFKTYKVFKENNLVFLDIDLGLFFLYTRIKDKVENIKNLEKNDLENLNKIIEIFEKC